jgi:hypothetical protein
VFPPRADQPAAGSVQGEGKAINSADSFVENFVENFIENFVENFVENPACPAVSASGGEGGARTLRVAAFVRTRSLPTPDTRNLTPHTGAIFRH